MTTTAYVIRFETNIESDLLMNVLTTNNAFLSHVDFHIHELWKDSGPDAKMEEVTHEE